MKNRGKKILNLFRRKCIAPLAYINNDYYMLCMNKYLKSIGVKLEGGGALHTPDCLFRWK